VVWRDTIPGLPDDLCPEMVTLPSGSFMRIPFENEWRSGGWIVPGRTVAVGAFAIGRYTVTFGEWKQAIAAGAPLSEPFDAGWGRDRRPVIDVESQIEEYIAWLNAALRMGGFPGTYRLPTEAEWEYACRAGTTTDYSFGDTISIDQANFAGGYQFGKRRQVLNKTAPVGSFPANQFGLHEMHGNVWELVQDKYRSYEEYRAYAAAPPGTHNTTAVLRGGSWKQASNHIRSASRYYRGSHSTSHSPGQSVGFRLARSFVTS
jgi:formylglycine-generating enzyme required for sulfatase activity